MRFESDLRGWFEKWRGLSAWSENPEGRTKVRRCTLVIRAANLVGSNRAFFDPHWTSGHAKTARQIPEVVLTVGNSYLWAVETLFHEIVHVGNARRDVHGPSYKFLYQCALKEITGVDIGRPRNIYKVDEAGRGALSLVVEDRKETR